MKKYSIFLIKIESVMLQRQYIALIFLLFLLTACEKEKTPGKDDIIFDAQEIEVTYKSDTFTMYGTLSVPQTVNERPPVVVIVQGSGYFNRDGYSPQQPQDYPQFYKAWAEYFKSKGVATFRYDKRFYTHPKLNVPNFTQDDQVNDALAAVNYLKNDAPVDANRIFILGHSEGGNLVPLAAKTDKAIKAMVIVNATSFAVDSLLMEQLKNAGADAQTMNYVQNGFVSIRNNSWPQSQVFLGGGKTFWRQWIEYSQNAEKYVLEADVPGFIIHSGADENFPGETLEKNKQSWQQIASKSAKLEFKSYANVSHNLFIGGTNQTQPANDVLLEITNWIKAR